MTANPATMPSPIATRGTTDIADRVVEKIAGRAASAVTDVRPPPATGFSRLTGTTTDPTVDAHVDDATVTLHIQLGVTYPTPVRHVARQVHTAVRSTVERLTGLAVTAVRVEVVDLPLTQHSRRRVI